MKPSGVNTRIYEKCKNVTLHSLSVVGLGVKGILGAKGMCTGGRGFTAKIKVFNSIRQLIFP